MISRRSACTQNVMLVSLLLFLTLLGAMDIEKVLNSGWWWWHGWVMCCHTIHWKQQRSTSLTTLLWWLWTAYNIINSIILIIWRFNNLILILLFNLFFAALCNRQSSLHWSFFGGTPSSCTPPHIWFTAAFPSFMVMKMSNKWGGWQSARHGNSKECRVRKRDFGKMCIKRNVTSPPQLMH